MKSTEQKQVLLTLVGAFFVAGFITGLNDLLVPHFKSIFALDHARAGLVPTSFFAAYLFISPVAGRFLTQWKAQSGVLLSLATMLLGAALFIPAASVESFPLFLVGLFILASGGALLQFFGNPYITELGGADASRILTLVIAFTPLGTSLAGPLAGPWLFSSQNLSAKDLITPYTLIGTVMILLFIGTRAQAWPVIAKTPVEEIKTDARWWQISQFRWGAVAIFGYVGSEVAIGSFLVAAAGLERYGSITPLMATRLVGLYWGGAMLGRFLGPWYMKRLGATFCLGLHIVAAMTAVNVFLLGSGTWALACLVTVGYCHSIMYPTITALTLQNTGALAPLGSAVLCTAVAGGALFPWLQGQFADQVGVAHSFVIPLIGHAIVFAFVIYTHRRSAP